MKNIPPKTFLEDLSTFIFTKSETDVKNITVSFKLSKEEHYKFDKFLHQQFGSGDFKHKDIIDLKVDGVSYQFIIDDSIEYDETFKMDEYGNTYI